MTVGGPGLVAVASSACRSGWPEVNAHFAAAVPNLRIMEIDIDRLAWDDELFTVVPPIENGHLIIPDTPGWGTEPNEEGIRANPAKGRTGLLHYRED